MLSCEDSTALEDSQIFKTNKCTQLFQKFIDQGFAIVHIDDLLLLGHTTTHMLDLIKQLHQIRSSLNPKDAPGKSFF